MTFGAPWAFAGLALLPLLWWLHRRARRPPVVEVPSLLFLEPEARPEGAPVARRLDVDLLLALAAAACLVVAATTPTVRRGPPGRTVRAVVLGGAAASAPGVRARLGDAVAALAHALGESDRLVVERVPAAGDGARPSDAALLAAARAGAAALRVVLADRLPRDVAGDAAADVVWVAVGDPAAQNVGIVAVDVAPAGEALRVFANVVNDGAEPVEVALRLARDGAAETTRALRIDAGGFASATFDLPATPAAPERMALDVVRPPGVRDDLPADDRVVLDRTPLAVRFDPSLAPAVREVVEGGLLAVLGDGGVRRAEDDAALLVTSDRAARAGPALVVAAAPPDAVLARPGEGPDVVAADPLARDLSAAGADLLYAPGDDAVEEGAALVLGRRAGDRVVPVVVRRGRVVRFAPDPTRGTPPPTATPLWPLFLENLAREVGGVPTRAGWRAVGLLDAASSRVGRDARPLDPAALARAPHDRPPDDRPLAPWLVGGALLCLAALWLRPLLGARG